jgi:hypothetical protein
MIAHNTVFDGAILAWRYNIHPAFMLCSMSMWRAQLGTRYRSSLAVCAETLQLEAKGDAVGRMDGKHLRDLTPYELQSYVQYCGHDTELCYQVTMQLLPRFTLSELLNVHAALRMYTQAVLVLDRNVLLEAQREEQVRRANIYTICAQHLGLPSEPSYAAFVKKIVGSTDKFAELLTALDVEVPMKASQRKVKGTDKKETVMIPAFAKTDAEFEALLDSEDEMIADLCEARLLSKSTQSETRIDRFLGVESRGTLPFPIQYAGAAVTQRYGGAEKLNLQNLRNGSPLRKAVCAPPGYKIVGGDLSQIELRMGWWVAGEHEKLHHFSSGHDPYKQSMADTFGLAYEGMAKADRQVGKVIQLSCIYGTGWEKVKNTVRIQAKRVVSDEDAQKMVRVYRDDHQYVKQAWDGGQDVLDAILQKQAMHVWHNGVGKVLAPDDTLWTKHGALERPSGLRLQYPNLHTRAGQWKDGRPKTDYIYIRQRERGGAPTVEFIYGSKVFQNFVQAAARDVIADAIAAIVMTKPSHWYLTSQIHDELWLVVPDDEAEHAAAWLHDKLVTRPWWCPDLPLACETYIAQNYGAGK